MSIDERIQPIIKRLDPEILFYDKKDINYFFGLGISEWMSDSKKKI